MSEPMRIEAVLQRGVRSKPDALPSWEYLATPVEILAGGELSVPQLDMVWSMRVDAHVFPWQQADRIARLITNAETHVFPVTCSREAPHPAAHVTSRPAKAAPLLAPVRPAPRMALVPSADWHATAPNCGVE